MILQTWAQGKRIQSKKKFIVAMLAFDKLSSNKPFSFFSFVILRVTLIIAHISI